jgi:CheY-like chemotaxis protein
MDLHMPVLDGYEAAAFIRSLDNPAKANVHIIALTASVAHNIYEKVQEAGMNDYLTKPFQPATLYQKLAALRIGKGDTELTGYSPEEIG